MSRRVYGLESGRNRPVAPANAGTQRLTLDRHAKKSPREAGFFSNNSVVNHSVMYNAAMHRMMHRAMMDHTVMHRPVHSVVNRLRHDRRRHQTQTQRQTHTP